MNGTNQISLRPVSGAICTSGVAARIGCVHRLGDLQGPDDGRHGEGF